MTDLGQLMAHLRSEGCVVAIYSRRSGSEESLVGTVVSLDTDRLGLDEIDTDGRATNETVTYDLDQVIAVDWGTGFLDALSDLHSAP